jgi:TonB family protein
MIEAGRVEYPLMALDSGITGDVVLEIEIGGNGTVGGVKILRSAHPLIDREACKAVRRSHFMPAVSGGRAVSGVVEAVVRFDARLAAASDPDRSLVAMLGPRPYVYELPNADRVPAERGDSPAQIRFDGIRFRGDISLDLFRSVAAEIEDQARIGEVIRAVETRFVLASFGDDLARYRPNVAVTIGSPGGDCASEKIVQFSWVEEDSTLSRSSVSVQ